MYLFLLLPKHLRICTRLKAALLISLLKLKCLWSIITVTPVAVPASVWISQIGLAVSKTPSIFTPEWLFTGRNYHRSFTTELQTGQICPLLISVTLGHAVALSSNFSTPQFSDCKLLTDRNCYEIIWQRIHATSVNDGRWPGTWLDTSAKAVPAPSPPRVCWALSHLLLWAHFLCLPPKYFQKMLPGACLQTYSLSRPGVNAGKNLPPFPPGANASVRQLRVL